MKIGIVGPYNPFTIKERFDCNDDIPNINISASSVNTYVKKLIEMGCEVTIFTSYQYFGLPYEIKGKGITVVFVSSECVKKGIGKSLVSLQIKYEIKKKVENLDILHAQWTYEYADAVRSFRNIIPICCSVRDWYPYLLSQKSFKHLYEKIASKYMHSVFNRVLNTSEYLFIANSDYTNDCIKSMFPKNDTRIIPNPIDEKRIRDHWEEYPKRKIFISISYSLEEERKNIITLLKAFHKYLYHDREAKLILIGGFSDAWKKKMTEQNLLEAVELKGILKQEDLFELLDQSSVMVHPSFEETFGNIFIEAMSRGVLCIGGENSGAVPEVLGYGKNGILCNVSEDDSIFSAMVLSNDAQYANEIVKNAFKKIKINYTDTVVTKKHIEAYQYQIKKFMVKGKFQNKI